MREQTPEHEAEIALLLQQVAVIKSGDERHLLIECAALAATKQTYPDLITSCTDQH